MQELTPEILKNAYRCDDSPLDVKAYFPITLNEVDWGSIQDAYGLALDIPLLLRALFSSKSDHRNFAMHLLYASICHQGSIYEATRHVVPFLINILDLADAEIDKVHIVAFLENIVNGYPATSGDQDWERKWHVENGRDFEEVVRQSKNDFFLARLAVKQGLQKYYLIISSQSDSSLQRATISLISRFHEDAPAISEFMNARLEVETESSIVDALRLGLNSLSQRPNH